MTTKKQQKELDVYNYFSLRQDIEPTSEDVEDYFKHTVEGKNLSAEKTDGLYWLLEAKRMSDIHIGMYEEGILSCQGIGYNMILGGEEGDTIVPVAVMEFLAKGMFKGIDQDVIREAYDEILHNTEVVV